MFGDPATNPKSWPVVQLVEVTSPKQWPTITQEQLTESGFPVYGANGRIGFYSEFNHAKETVLVTCRGATCGTINICEPQSYVTGNAMSLDDPNPALLNVPYLESVPGRVCEETWVARSSRATIGETRGKCKNKIQCICGSPYMRFQVLLWGDKNSEISKNLGRKHPNVSPEHEVESGEIGRKSRSSPQLHRRH